MTRRLGVLAEVRTETSAVLIQSGQRLAVQSSPGLRSTGSAARNRRSLECRHHWEIEAALGPLSAGVCRLCGEERTFRNQFLWEEIATARTAVTCRKGGDRARALGYKTDNADGLTWRQGGEAAAFRSR